MKPHAAWIRLTLSTALALALVACGSGGDSGGAPAPAPAPPSVSPATCTGTEAFSAIADSSVMVGKAGGAVLAGCNGAVSNVQWTQTSGPIVTLLSAKTQVISFEPPAAGAYSFTVAFVDAGGAA
ncbi:MAG: hypothetical protein H0V63_04735, partial [Burkholderiaceae bacterium]|nr:hypothetical protein [Burkholderiaceae bacterium]